eukprot:TRINITY_DN8634_c0_g1_i1.p1 TRINITY_DN8634_c0_g1~~TRINITY_DN8634_c0_g1_i1.p1  ORF type:complete len:486 (+),score=182.33 TRINITY_DN8634_c0_g1_i1:1388-2845(+)
MPLTMNLKVMGAAAGSVGKIVAVCAVGYFCSRYPKDEPYMTRDIRKGIGRLLLEVLVPILAAHSLMTTVSLETVGKRWPLLLWSTLSIVLGAVCASLFARALGLTGAYRRGFTVAGSFGNSVGVPLLMMGALCEGDILRAQYGDSCRDLAYGYIMFYGIPWRFAMFGLAMPWITAAGDEAADAKPAAPAETAGRPAVSTDHSPQRSLLDSQAGVDGEVELAAVEVAASEGSDSGSDDGAQEREVAASVLLTRTVSAAIDDIKAQQGTEGNERAAPKSCIARLAHRIATIVKDPNIWFPIFCAGAMLVPGVKDFVVGEKLADGSYSQPGLPVLATTMKTLGEPVVALITLSMAAAILPKGAKLSEFVACDTIKKGLGLLFIRGVLTPLIGFGLVYLVQDSFGMPGNRLQWLVILVQFAMPSPQLVIVAMTSIGRHELAKQMGPVYTVLYLCSVVTLTFWVSMALEMTQDYDPGDEARTVDILNATA